MMGSRSNAGFRAALLTVAAVGAAAIGCIDRPIAPVRPRVQSGVSEEIQNNALDKVDLLLEVDNSNSMTENQANISAQLGRLIEALTNPPIDPTTMMPVRPPVRDLHVGIITSDLGTAGAPTMIPNCYNSPAGDDGLLNPIRFGQAMAAHLPWLPSPNTGTMAPAGFRPAKCDEASDMPDPRNAYGTFLEFVSGTTDVATFTDDFRCNAALYINGCGLEQQLESAYRALTLRANPGDPSAPNRDFLREDALLAIVLLTDEEDGSVRDCDYAEAGDNCQDARSVFDSRSQAWGDFAVLNDLNLNGRFYLYDNGGDKDPTWPLDRYYDPNSASRGFLALKPNHPERVVFAAITGVPLNIPTVPGPDGRPATNWDALLGEPGADPNDFNARNSRTAINEMTNEGAISMWQNNPDPICMRDRVVPACRREGSSPPPPTATMPCSQDAQYFATPSRRVVEIARRFAQSPLCAGAPCNNGLVTSICSRDYTDAMNQIIEKIGSNLKAACLPRTLTTRTNDMGQDEVDCLVRETLPEGETVCDEARGRFVPTAESDRIDMATGRTRCEIRQVATDPSSLMPVGGLGWFYDRTPDATGTCNQRISFTPGAEPGNGTTTRLECIQAVTGS